MASDKTDALLAELEDALSPTAEGEKATPGNSFLSNIFFWVISILQSFIFTMIASSVKSDIGTR